MSGKRDAMVAFFIVYCLLVGHSERTSAQDPHASAIVAGVWDGGFRVVTQDQRNSTYASASGSYSKEVYNFGTIYAGSYGGSGSAWTSGNQLSYQSFGVSAEGHGTHLDPAITGDGWPIGGQIDSQIRLNSSVILLPPTSWEISYGPTVYLDLIFEVSGDYGFSSPGDPNSHAGMSTSWNSSATVGYVSKTLVLDGCGSGSTCIGNGKLNSLFHGEADFPVTAALTSNLALVPFNFTLSVDAAANVVNGSVSAYVRAHATQTLFAFIPFNGPQPSTLIHYMTPDGTVGKVYYAPSDGTGTKSSAAVVPVSGSGTPDLQFELLSIVVFWDFARRRPA